MRGNQKGEAGAEAPGAGGPIAGGGRAPAQGLLEGGPQTGPSGAAPAYRPAGSACSVGVGAGSCGHGCSLSIGTTPRQPRVGRRQSACPGARSNDCAGLPCAGLTRGLNLRLWWLRKRALGTWLLAAWSPLLRGDRSVAHFSSGLSVCYF